MEYAGIIPGLGWKAYVKSGDNDNAGFPGIELEGSEMDARMIMRMRVRPWIQRMMRTKTIG